MRVSRIEVCDFRGFPGPGKYDFNLGDARNLLVYGENGSGKSSLYRALEEFFNLDPKAKPFANFKNVFSDPAFTEGEVLLHFHDGASSSGVRWAFGGDRQTTDARVAGTAIRLGCIDYRSLLRTNFLHQGESVNLFSLAVRHLLANYAVTVKGRSTTVGALWRRVLQHRPKNHHKGNLTLALAAVTDFNDAFEPIIPALSAKAEDLLAGFPGCDFKLALSFPKVDYDKSMRNYVGTELNLQVTFNGIPIPSHHHFFNEARLSAIALAIYLAGLLISVPPPPPEGAAYPSILVLDDVLIGLDLANRLPVLKVIEKEFVRGGWQVLLFTFDRAWYEVARQQLQRGSWRHYELFTARVGDHEQPMLVPDDDHLYRALWFLEMGQVKAAGVHVRAAFETILKSACYAFGLPVKFHADPRKVPASDLWSALRAAEYDVVPPMNYVVNGKGQLVSWQPKTKRERVVPPALVQRIEHAVTWVLNPLSHSQTVDRYRVEIEDAIYVIDDLDAAVSLALQLRSVHPISVMRQIIALLKARITKLQAP
jgi:hypothetical protein